MTVDTTDTDEKWQTAFRPTYHPDWGDNGMIHLDGEKEVPLDMTADEVIDMLQSRCEVVGGLCTHQPDDQTFTVSSQMGHVGYCVHYNDDGEITQIDLKEHDNQSVHASDDWNDGSYEPECSEYSYTVDEILEVDSHV